MFEKAGATFAYLLIAQAARTTPARIQKCGADSGAMSGRPILRVRFWKLPTPPFSPTPQRRPNDIFFATQSRRSPTPPTPRKLIVTWSSMRWRRHTVLFCVGPVENGATQFAMLVIPPFSPTPQRRPNDIFFATQSRRSPTPPTPRKWTVTWP